MTPLPVPGGRQHTVLGAVLALLLVVLATCSGIIGTALIFTALTDHTPGAVIWGVTLALVGLYWCSRVLALSQQAHVRQRQSRRQQVSPVITDHVLKS